MGNESGMKPITGQRQVMRISLCLLAGMLSWGCLNGAENIECVVHADCGTGRCVNGLCYDADFPDDSEYVSDTDTDADDSDAQVLAAKIDVLFVVDNSGSMTNEQELLATSMYSFFNALHGGMTAENRIDTRIAVVTSDMGVSYEGGIFKDDPAKPRFDTPQVNCSGDGDAGEMLQEYTSVSEVTVPVTPSKIACTAGDTECPTNWTCTNMNLQGIGTCTPRYNQTTVPCPDITPYTHGLPFVSPMKEQEGQTVMDYSGFIEVGACLMHTGINGCNFEQPLAAIPAALTHPDQKNFLRGDALTVIFVITDEEDCSIGDVKWFHLDELTSISANLACGHHPDYLQNVADIQNRILVAKQAATGVDATDSVMFVGIVGVPVGSPCEGRGDQLGSCKDVSPDVNGTGTMSAPEEIGRTASSGVEQFYFEYACRRYATGATDDDPPVTAAYPGMRFVNLAQLFGDNGYIYSICNEDWTPIMTEMGEVVLQRLE